MFLLYYEALRVMGVVCMWVFVFLELVEVFGQEKRVLCLRNRIITAIGLYEGA